MRLDVGRERVGETVLQKCSLGSSDQRRSSAYSQWSPARRPSRSRRVVENKHSDRYRIMVGE